MRYHLIAIGGSIMHNLAIDLQDQGHQVTGSDDEIYEPSRSRLSEANLLPDPLGWNPDRIDADIDTIILGKHARSDNPELLRAQELNLSIRSFPEFFAENSQATKRVVVTGSHGKTSTTSMIMHVLNALQMDFDYLVGAQLDGFKKMVKLSGSDILVVEGDEYPSSSIDDRAKMMHFKGNISIVTGIAWDHVNIYKTEEAYQNLFKDYLIQRGSDEVVFFDMTDAKLLSLALHVDCKCLLHGYDAVKVDKKGRVISEDKAYPIEIFGEHNLKNLNAALLACQRLGIEKEEFLRSIGNFTGAAKRLQLVLSHSDLKFYRDFAHAPSKVKATTEAISSRYAKENICSILELHTFSSLDKSFIKQYRGALEGTDEAIVYFDPHALRMKKMPDLDPDYVRDCFEHPNITVINSPDEFQALLTSKVKQTKGVLLVMSSGNLGGTDLNALLDEVKAHS